MKRALYSVLFTALALYASAAGKMSYYFQRAEEAYVNENFDECLRFCEEGVKNNVKDGHCWAVMAEIYSKRAYSRYAEALEAADKALAILKKDKTWTPFVHAIKGDVYYKIGDYPASRKSYAAAMAMNPEDMRYLISYADVCGEDGDWEECAAAYRKAMAFDPGMTYVYGELANAEYHLGQKEEARKHCRMAALLSDGENIKSHLVLAQLAMDEHNLPLAAKEFAAGMFAEKNYNEVADTLVDMYPELMTAAVLNEVEKAPADIETNSTAAVYFFNLPDYVSCLYYQHKAYEAQELPALQAYMSYAYWRLGELDEAEAMMKKALQSDSLDADNYMSLGNISLDAGRGTDAERYYKKHIALSPSSAEGYRMCARSFIYRDNEQALHYLDTAVMLAQGEETMNVLFNRAEVLRLLGREEEALRDLHAAEACKGSEAFSDLDMLYVDALLGNRSEVDRYVDSAKLTIKRNFRKYVSYAGVYACMRDKEQTLHYMEEYFKHGGHEMAPFRNHFRMRFLADDKDFNAILDRYEQRRLAEVERLRKMLAGTDDAAGLTEIPFTMQGGVCQVKCSVNGLPFYFVFDTGASDVTLSSVEANFMLKNGYLSEADFMGKQNYITADGEIHEGTVINLRELRVGDLVLRNIKASVVSSQSAPLLLGQSVFRRFGRVELDNKRSVIRFVNDQPVR